MDVFSHIAYNGDADKVAQMCYKYYGEYPVDEDNAAEMLQGIVDQVGEPGLRDVMSLHPEKGVMTEMFAGRSASSHDCEKCRRLNQMYQFTNNGATGILSTMAPYRSQSNLERSNRYLTIGMITLSVVIVYLLAKK